MARLIDAVIGQRAAWDVLMQQLNKDRLAHALAFAGPAGVGKKKIAWALAQALVCEREHPPCGECGPCRRVEGSQSESVLFLEPTAGALKLEAAQQILHFLTLRSLGRARVVILDDAQRLNPQAANALLKILEEPPARTYFVLLVNEISQLLPTLRSRVQVVRFAPLTPAQLQQVSADPAPEWMLRSARGSAEQLARFRDAGSEESRAAVLDFLRQALHGRHEGVPAMVERAKERDEAVGLLHLLQQLLRDWSLLGESDLIHSDLESALRALPPVAPERRTALWHAAFQMELDFAAHVDKALLFENFFYRAKGALG
jgi:DNA polymerase-3 subunit delta'